MGDQELYGHRELWALFQLRQIQRTIAEVFLRCFELALGAGAESVREVIEYWREQSSEDFQLDRWTSFEVFVRDEAKSLSVSASFVELSAAWHSEVHEQHPLYDDIAPGDTSREFERAWRMLARWWIRAQHWLREGNAEFLTMGDRSRMCLRWFAGWLQDRLAQPLSQLADELFSEIVFSQHIKVALSRFDG